MAGVGDITPAEAKDLQTAILFIVMTPHHLTVSEFARYHRGEVREPELSAIEEHLAWCQECLDRAEENLRSNQTSGQEQEEHVTTEDLEDYHLGNLKFVHSALIKLHCFQCQDCADRMLSIERFIHLLRAGVVRGNFEREVRG